MNGIMIKYNIILKNVLQMNLVPVTHNEPRGIFFKYDDN